MNFYWRTKVVPIQRTRAHSDPSQKLIMASINFVYSYWYYDWPLSHYPDSDWVVNHNINNSIYICYNRESMEKLQQSWKRAHRSARTILDHAQSPQLRSSLKSSQYVLSINKIPIDLVIHRTPGKSRNKPDKKSRIQFTIINCKRSRMLVNTWSLTKIRNDLNPACHSHPIDDTFDVDCLLSSYYPLPIVNEILVTFVPARAMQGERRMYTNIPIFVPVFSEVARVHIAEIALHTYCMD
jgi:hypothetical protein